MISSTLPRAADRAPARMAKRSLIADLPPVAPTLGVGALYGLEPHEPRSLNGSRRQVRDCRADREVGARPSFVPRNHNQAAKEPNLRCWHNG